MVEVLVKRKTQTHNTYRDSQKAQQQKPASYLHTSGLFGLSPVQRPRQAQQRWFSVCIFPLSSNSYWEFRLDMRSPAIGKFSYCQTLAFIAALNRSLQPQDKYYHKFALNITECQNR